MMSNEVYLFIFIFWGYFDPENIFCQMIKINNFRGDLIHISAESATPMIIVGRERKKQEKKAYAHVCKAKRRAYRTQVRTSSFHPK